MNKAVVSVVEMARMVGLSRQRFYQLLGSTFPYPLYDVASKRPFYTEEMQQVCLEVRKRNFGIDGKPVLFYSSGHQPYQRKPIRPTKPPARKKRFAGLIEGLAALGLPSVTDQQVGAVVKTLFPKGAGGEDQAEVLRAVFLHLKGQNSQGNVP